MSIKQEGRRKCIVEESIQKGGVRDLEMFTYRVEV